jgi:hypothetical protein
MIAVAESKLGQKETKENQGPIVEWSIEKWTRRQPDDTSWAKWCAGFVSTCVYLALEKLDREEDLEKWKRLGSLNCTGLYKRLGEYITPGKEAIRGDLVLFGKSPEKLHHVGIVVSVDQQKIYTIEGNAGDAVRYESYSYSDSDVYCFIRLPY